MKAEFVLHKTLDRDEKFYADQVEKNLNLKPNWRFLVACSDSGVLQKRIDDIALLADDKSEEIADRVLNEIKHLIRVQGGPSHCFNKEIKTRAFLNLIFFASFP